MRCFILRGNGCDYGGMKVDLAIMAVSMSKPLAPCPCFKLFDAGSARVVVAVSSSLLRIPAPYTRLCFMAEPAARLAYSESGCVQVPAKLVYNGAETIQE